MACLLVPAHALVPTHARRLDAPSACITLSWHRPTSACLARSTLTCTTPRLTSHNTLLTPSTIIVMPAHELDEVYGMLLDQDHGILSLVGLHAQHPDPGPRILRPALARCLVRHHAQAHVPLHSRSWLTH